MKASVLIGPKKSIVQEVANPQIGANDVLLQVKACGVCRSELQQWLGTEGGQDWQERGEGPIILGHEPSGIIADLRRDVKKFHQGQNVGERTRARAWNLIHRGLS